MKDLAQIIAELEAENKECALYGSFVTGNMWTGSDINLLAIEASTGRITSSATNYAFGDWHLDIPRITKVVVGNQLLQIEVFPASSLARAADDWILCDRLYTAKAGGAAHGPLYRAIENIRVIRNDLALRSRRVDWYVSTVTRLLHEADGDPRERAFAYRLAALLLGCAQLEASGQTKGSYKRLYRQCQSAGDEGFRAAYERLYAIEGIDNDRLSKLLARGLQIMEEMRRYYETRTEELRNAGAGLCESLTTTLAISSKGVPTGKGILENLQIGDREAALDCLRKATLWLTNSAVKIQAAATGAWPVPGGYFAALRNMPYGQETVTPFLVDLFALNDDADRLQQAFESLVNRYRQPADGVSQDSPAFVRAGRA